MICEMERRLARYFIAVCSEKIVKSELSQNESVGGTGEKRVFSKWLKAGYKNIFNFV